MVGVVLPVLMVLLDPAVFHSRVFGVGMPVLGEVKAYSYVATTIAVCAISLWLVPQSLQPLRAGSLLEALSSRPF